MFLGVGLEKGTREKEHSNGGLTVRAREPRERESENNTGCGHKEG